MIGSVFGEVIAEREDKVLVETKDGLGYWVFTNKKNENLEKVRYYTAHIPKENQEDLYGFLSLEELDFFNHLLSVKGVGPKAALKILKELSVVKGVELILNKNTAELEKIKGISKKCAQQICLDLPSKLSKLFIKNPLQKDQLENSNVFQDVLDAALEMGIETRKVELLLAEMSLSSVKGKTSEELLKEVLSKVYVN